MLLGILFSAKRVFASYVEFGRSPPSTYGSDAPLSYPGLIKAYHDTLCDDMSEIVTGIAEQKLTEEVKELVSRASKYHDEFWIFFMSLNFPKKVVDIDIAIAFRSEWTAVFNALSDSRQYRSFKFVMPNIEKHLKQVNSVANQKSPIKRRQNPDIRHRPY